MFLTGRPKGRGWLQLAYDNWVAVQLWDETPMLLPDFRHILCEVVALKVWHLRIEVRAVRVWRVDQLARVGEPHGLVPHSLQVLAPKRIVVGAVRARCVADALDHDEPPRALVQNVVSNVLEFQSPVGLQPKTKSGFSIEC